MYTLFIKSPETDFKIPLVSGDVPSDSLNDIATLVMVHPSLDPPLLCNKTK